MGEADGVWERQVRLLPHSAWRVPDALLSVSSSCRLQDLVITTKLFFGTKPGVNNKGLSRKHILEGIEASLKRLQLSYVDVLFCHRPDPVTPIEEVCRAMNWCIEQGKAFYWGTSEWSGCQLTEAIGVCDRLGLIRPCVEQPEYNVFARQRVEVEYEPVYALSGMGLTTWSPLASGILTGKYSGKHVPAGSRLALDQYKFLLNDKFGASAWQVDAADELTPIAAELGCSAAQLALAWCLTNKRVSSVILGATSVAQLEENLACLQVLPKLTADVVARVEAIGGGKGKPAPHSSFTQVHSMRDTARVAYSKGF